MLAVHGCDTTPRPPALHSVIGNLSPDRQFQFFQPLFGVLYCILSGPVQDDLEVSTLFHRTEVGDGFGFMLVRVISLRAAYPFVCDHATLDWHMRVCKSK